MRAILMMLALLGAFSLSAGLTGCEEKGPMEEMGESIDDAADDAGDAMEEAADDIEDAADDATN